MIKFKRTATINENRSKNRNTAVLIAIFWVLISNPIISVSATIFDTGIVSIGTTGLYGGSAVNANQYLGVSFQATGDFFPTEIGGHFGGTPATTIFGALFKINNSSDFPQLANLQNDPNLIGYSVFSVPNQSNVVWASFSGSSEIMIGQWYTLVFGSGIFGASGQAFTPYEGVTQNTHADSFWYSSQTGFLGQPQPYSTLGYFGLQGTAVTPVPEPSIIWLFGSGLGLLAVIHRRKLKIANDHVLTRKADSRKQSAMIEALNPMLARIFSSRPFYV